MVSNSKRRKNASPNNSSILVKDSSLSQEPPKQPQKI